MNFQENPKALKRNVCIGIAVLLMALIWLAINSNVSWTGFGKYITKETEEFEKGKLVKTTREIQAGKTLWDWLQLAGTVAIPVVLAGGGYMLNQREQQRAEEREKAEQERAAENLREEALQTYFDRISELLLEKNLGQPDMEENPARDIARARTLTVLNRLGEDGKRKAAIVRFLHEAELIKKNVPIVNLSGADLDMADLRWANLDGVDLSSANLSRANFERAKLDNANLKWTNFSGVNFIWSTLIETDLSFANLNYANFTGTILRKIILNRADLNYARFIGANLMEGKLTKANFTGADLTKANFTGADLRGAIFTKANLSFAKFTGADLKGADFTEANLTGANFKEVIFTEVDQIKVAKNWDDDSVIYDPEFFLQLRPSAVI